VLVKGNTIERISASPITVDAKSDVRVIAANGRVLMPGFIDAHWHAFMAATPQMPMKVGIGSWAEDSSPAEHGSCTPSCGRTWSPLAAQANARKRHPDDRVFGKLDRPSDGEARCGRCSQ
jgi:predicted amidohydrolase YtcJ